MDIGTSYSTVSADELLAKVLPQYELENPKKCIFWERGVNDTYQVHCADEIYSLRVYRHNLRTRDAIDFEMAAINHLHKRGANVANPIARRDGGYVTELNAPEGLRHAIVTTHAKGSNPDYDEKDNGRLFGAAVAELHVLSDDFKTEHTRPRLEVEFLLETSLEIIKPFVQDNPDKMSFFEDKAGKLRNHIEKIALKDLETGFCHGDCHGSNVHVDNGVMTHYDFDCCGMGYRVFDLATFRWGSLNDKNASEIWSSFLEGYRSVREFGEAEEALIETFVVIRHVWWMALILGNANDFGHNGLADKYIDRNGGHIEKMMVDFKIAD